VTDWLPDGRTVLLQRWDQKTGWDIATARLDGERGGAALLNGRSSELSAQVSPNGRFVAYTSTESGRDEVYVTEFPNPKSKWQVSTNGGAEPRWRRDGRELFYVENGKLMAVDVNADAGAFHIGPARLLFEKRPYRRDVRNHYVVSADGKRFLFIVPGEPAYRPTLTVVMNWR
jgi:hypothetical protein